MICRGSILRKAESTPVVETVMWPSFASLAASVMYYFPEITSIRTIPSINHPAHNGRFYCSSKAWTEALGAEMMACTR